MSRKIFNLLWGTMAVLLLSMAPALAVPNGAGYELFPTSNVGINSATPGQKLDVQGTARITGFTLTGNGAGNGFVMVGNGVGVGTWMPAITLGINSQWTGTTGSNIYYSFPGANVGIGSANPGQILDVTGTVRTTGFAMSGQTPISGYVLTASDSAGDTTWTSPGSVSGWTISGNNVYETLGGNVGIGTTLLTTSALTVMNGNVGIGTWKPGNSLEVVGGNIGIGTAYNLIGIGTTSTILTLRTDTSSIYLGWQAGASTTLGPLDNAAVGYMALTKTTGSGNVAVGQQALASNTTGTNNVAVGAVALANISNGISNTAVGSGALNPLGALGGSNQQNTALGLNAGSSILGGSNNFNSNQSTFLGDSTDALANNDTNETVIGYAAVGNGSNTVTIGNTSVVSTILEGNVGIGTFYTNNQLSLNGAVGIGTANSAYVTTVAPAGGIIVQGNVGMGSLTPGQKLDVTGTVRTTFFTMSGQTPASGYILSAIDSAGDATWSSLGAVVGWTVSGNNVYETASGNVGIGTTSLTQGSLVVTNGNVGIGTWAPLYPLEVVPATGSGGLGVYVHASALINGLYLGYNSSTSIGDFGQGSIIVFSGSNMLVDHGNVGIGSANPGQVLDVTGTVRTTAFTMSGQTPISGYVLTASDSAGDTTWTSPGSVSGWTISGNNVYETLGGNVGIGTTLLTTSALTVMNGNVGIGTWIPASALEVNGNIKFSGLTNSTIGVNQAAGAGNTLTIQAQQSTGANNGGNLYLFGGNSSAANGSVFISPGSGVGTLGNTILADSGVGSSGLVGIGTITPKNELDINGAAAVGSAYAGIKTAPLNGLIVQGNVGLGSTNPGQALDVTGTVRTTFFTMSGQTPANGYILSATDSAGDATWSSLGAVVGWTVSGNNVYETASGNVGIGTTTVNQGTALAVTNGNVGIGTWNPVSALEVNGNINLSAGANRIIQVNGNSGPGANLTVQAATSNSGGPVSGGNLYLLGGSGSPSGNTILADTGSSALGNVGIGTITPKNELDINGAAAVGSAYAGIKTAPLNGLIVQGNVGLGSINPGQALDVTGTVRTTAFTMSGQTPISGYVLTASDSAGDTTWTSPGSVSGWTISGNNVYETLGGNVGIGTTNVNQGALVVTNGNVGIGTWVPAAPFQVHGSTQDFYIAPSGNIGLGTQNAVAAIQIGSAVSIFGPPSQLDLANTSNATGYPQIVGDWISTGFWGIGPATISGADSTLRIGVTSNIGQPWISSTRMNLVVDGNIGIGTINTTGMAGALYVNGNVGIGSLTPGQKLDVTGTVRTTFFAMSGQTPQNGYILSAIDSAGDATWSSLGAVVGWTVSGNNVYETAGGNVGIGTTSLTQGSLLVTNGNVGIGTWAPASLLQINQINGSPFAVNSSGKVGIGTIAPQTALAVTSGNVGIGTWTAANPLSIVGGASIGSTIYANATAPSNGLLVSGNVGLGSLTPGQALDVQGTVRTTAFTMSGQTPISGYVLTASDSAGDTTWTSPGSVSGWTISGNNVYETLGGNVGIGTTTVNQGSLVVTNGNVGIGTWVPADTFQVGKYASAISGFEVDNNGNVGIGTTITSFANFTVMDGNIGIGTFFPAHLVDIKGSNIFDGQLLSITGTNQTVGLGINSAVNGRTFINLTVPAGATWIMNNDPTTALRFMDDNNINNTGLPQDSVLALSTNNNVGIGTWTPLARLAVNGNIGIGAGPSSSYLGVTPPAGGMIAEGNVGIGSLYPGQKLDVTGTVRTTFFAMSGQTPQNGYILSAIDSAGDATWSSLGAVVGWTVSGNNVYETAGGNVGIGTTTVNQGSLVVTNGNVGIGTWAPQGSLIVQTGNVGIGTTTPGTTLDVKGIVRATGISELGTVGGNNVTSLGSTIGGGTITAGGSIGALAGGLADVVGLGTATISSNNAGSVAYGFADSTAGAASILSNNNGSIAMGDALNGTISSAASGSIAMGYANGGTLQATSAGSVAIGQNVQSTAANALTFGSSVVNNIANTFMVGFNVNPTLTVTSANVGIGSVSPGQALDVQGTVRTTAFTMSGQTPISGYVLTASDSAGDTTWTSPGSVSGWTISGNNVYETASGNVGIGTTTVNQGSLVVTNGNVGIGTWVPGNSLDIYGGNIGIGTSFRLNAINNGTSIMTMKSDTSSMYVGYNAGFNTTQSNQQNAALGYQSLAQSNTGTGNSAVGYQTLWGVTTGSFNSVVGFNAGNPFGGGLQHGSYNVFLGANSGPIVPGDYNNSVGIGSYAVVGASNVMVLGGMGANALNVGIGTFVPNGKLIVSGGNVGIGSLSPGQALDVTGTVRTTFFTMSGQTPANGYILSAIDSAGDATWSSLGAVVGWTVSGNNVYETAGGNVGIGTTTVNQGGALVVTNGNVGIGTWAPIAALQLGGFNQSVPGAPLQTALYTFSTGNGYPQLVGDWANNGLWGIGPASTSATDNNLEIGPTTHVGTTWNSTFKLNLVIPYGSVGIGTFNTSTSALAVIGGNVGIGSVVPGQALDVQGTVRTTFFAMSGQTPISGYVLTANDSAGDATWTSAGAVSGWTAVGNNVYETLSGNVGIGTTTVNQAALVVTNGNVGIGTWAPSSTLSVAAWGTATLPTTTMLGGITMNNNFISNTGHVGINTPWSLTEVLSVNGGVGIGTALTNNAYIGNNIAPSGGLIVQNNVGIGTFNPFGGGLIVLPTNTGNVGIGSLTPGQALDVTGTVRTTFFTMSGQTPANGYVMSAIDSAGDATWSSLGAVVGWTVSGNNVYETDNGNVGIGTTTVNQGAALVVTNGNVGIGTWAVAGGNLIIRGGGNVGIGSTWPGQVLDVQGTARMSGNVGIGSSITDSNGTQRLTITSTTIEVNLQ